MPKAQVLKPMKKVTVVVPEIKLALEDLAYLRSLDNHKTSCIPSNKARNKLLFLGLIEESEIQPSDKEVLEYTSKRDKCVKDFGYYVAMEDWEKATKAARDMGYLHAPLSHKGIVLTDAGKSILLHGKAETLMAQEGCL